MPTHILGFTLIPLSRISCNIFRIEFPRKSCYAYIGIIKINRLIFKMGMLIFFEGAKRVKWVSTQSCDQFDISSVQQKEKVYIKYIHEYIYPREGSVQPKCQYLFFGSDLGSICRGLGHLTVIQKNENGKKWPNFKTSVQANYRYKFKFLLILNF